MKAAREDKRTRAAFYWEQRNRGSLLHQISARPDRATVRFDTGRWTAKLALKERVPKIDPRAKAGEQTARQGTTKPGREHLG